MDVVVIFLGKRGAGVRFVEIFQNFYHLEENVNLKSLTSRGVAYGNLPSSYTSLTVKALENWKSIARSPFIIWQFVQVLRKIPNWRKNIFIFVLPAVSDFFLYRILSIFGVSIVTLVHDLHRHPGDKWPWKSSIKFRIKKSTKVITLSEFVNRQLSTEYKIESFVLPHPVFPLLRYVDLNSIIDTKRKYILFVGRIRNYKGVDLLLKSYLQSNSKDQFDLVIAGEGEFKKVDDRRVVYLNRWLQDIEIETLIEHAAFVVFPYTEATQSGIIPTCIVLNKPIIVSDSGALSEQLEKYSDWTSFQSGDENHLRFTIDEYGQRYLDGNFSDHRIQAAREESETSSINFVRSVLKICKSLDPKS